MTNETPKRITLKDIAIVFWRMFHVVAFYPVMIGLLIWIHIKGAHWIWGLGIIAAILIFDPIWRLLFGRIFSRK